jgi:hypothetical protein
MAGRNEQLGVITARLEIDNGVRYRWTPHHDSARVPHPVIHPNTTANLDRQADHRRSGHRSEELQSLSYPTFRVAIRFPVCNISGEEMDEHAEWALPQGYSRCDVMSHRALLHSGSPTFGVAPRPNAKSRVHKSPAGPAPKKFGRQAVHALGPCLPCRAVHQAYHDAGEIRSDYPSRWTRGYPRALALPIR